MQSTGGTPRGLLVGESIESAVSHAAAWFVSSRHCRYASPGFALLLGLADGRMLDRDLPPGAPGELLDWLDHVWTTGTDLADQQLVAADGHRWRVELSPVRDAAGRVSAVGVMAVNLSRAAGEVDELRHRATHDHLTGLPNRAELLQRLSAALARGASDPDHAVAVCFIDLDRFGVVNNQHGHAIGDEVLIQVADRLRAALRAGDSVGRFGGDEFVVVCQDASGDPASLQRLGARLRRVMAEPIMAGGMQVDVGLSIGFAVAGPDTTADALIHEADQAMYDEKRGGTGGAGAITSFAARDVPDPSVEELMQQMSELRRQINARGVLEQAKGVLMQLHGCTAADALELLLDESRRADVGVSTLAAHVVADVASTGLGVPSADLAAGRVATTPGWQ